MQPASTVVSVTMNTAVDRVLRAPGFAVGAHLLAEPVSQTPAGKGINLARALARLGRSNIATGFVGQGEAQAFEALLRESEDVGRVNNQLLTVRGPTRENITVVDPDAGTDTHLRTTGYELMENDIARLTTKIGLLSREGAVVVFAGSLPAGLDDSALAKMVRTAQWGGADVVLDLDGHALGSVLDAVGKAVWMVSPNRAELADAFADGQEMNDQALLDVARAAAERGGWVLVSLGAEGGILVTESGAWRGVCEIDHSRVVSTVGSGDCLVAAVVDARLSGTAPAEALKRGLAVATASTTDPNPSGFDLMCVVELEAKVQIVQV